MQKPDAKKLAEMIAVAPLTEEEKREVLESLEFLSEERLAELYKKLDELIRTGKEVEASSKRVDLKYRIKVEGEVDKTKEE